MPKSVLCFGAAGYIGSVLTPLLLNFGYKVTAIDNYLYRQNSLLDLCHHQNFNIIRGDVRDKKLLEEQIPKHDVIINLAALVGMPSCKRNPLMAEQVNYEAVKNMMKLKSKDQLFLYPNTNSGYGQGEGIIFTEESSLNPISVYGITKCKSEKLIREYENTVVFRLATVFGASPRFRLDLLVNDFTFKAWSDRYITLFESNFIRNYVYIGDVAELFIWSINNWNSVKDQVFNFGLSNANLTKLELCNKIKKQISDFLITRAEIGKDPDQRNYIVSNEKIERTGFSATTSVDEGIKELIKSFQIINPYIYSNLT